MAHVEEPLVKRLFYGLCVREGLRKSNIVQLQWSDLFLDLPDGGGSAVIDKSKNGRDVMWALDRGTAEALRRWRKLCPSDRCVFPAAAVPGHCKTDTDRPMYVGHIAKQLRSALKKAGVTRAKLFEKNGSRLHFRAHDLRSTFVTIALANGKTEDWVSTRTGHRSSDIIAHYRQDASTLKELNLGWFKPLHEAIPELAMWGSQNPDCSQ